MTSFVERRASDFYLTSKFHSKFPAACAARGRKTFLAYMFAEASTTDQEHFLTTFRKCCTAPLTLLITLKLFGTGMMQCAVGDLMNMLQLSMSRSICVRLFP